MYHIYRMYLTTMSARLHHSSDLEGLREGLTWSADDGPEEISEYSKARQPCISTLRQQPVHGYTTRGKR